MTVPQGGGRVIFTRIMAAAIVASGAGFIKEAHIIVRVAAPGHVEPGALIGDHAGVIASVAAGPPGVGADVLIGGGQQQISLRPIRSAA